jgi:hypothetical protein
MRTRTSAIRGVLLACLTLAGCDRAPAPAAEPAPADATASGVATPPAAPIPPLAPRPAMPALTYAVLEDPNSDSPFRWPDVDLGPTRPRLIDSEVWVPVAPVLAVLRPRARMDVAGGTLRVDGEAVAVPLQTIEGESWAPVARLAYALGGYARRHPDDGSIALWPAPTLRWLANHGDPKQPAPVLVEARASGLTIEPDPLPRRTTP